MDRESSLLPIFLYGSIFLKEIETAKSSKLVAFPNLWQRRMSLYLKIVCSDLSERNMRSGESESIGSEIRTAAHLSLLRPWMPNKTRTAVKLLTSALT